MKRLLLLLLLMTPAAWAQSGNTLTLEFAGVPSGTCAFMMFAVNSVTADLYSCNPLTNNWELISGGSTMANPMDAIGQMIGGGAVGAATKIEAGLTGQVVTATTGATPAFASPGVSGRTVAGTTDTILCDSATALRDRLTTITYTSNSAVAVTLPQAGSSGCASSFTFGVLVAGGGAVTITPTTSTISSTDGANYTSAAATLVLYTGQYCTISSPDNTNYLARCTGPRTPLTAGTSVTLVPPRAYYVCTGACSVTPPVPAAGYEFCVRNDNNISTAISLINISGVQYEATARTSYYAANRKLVSGGAVTDQICIVGRDATHYNIWSSTGTWTDTAP